MTIRVLIADDHRNLREALRRLVAMQDDMQVIGEAASEKKPCRRCRLRT